MTSERALTGMKRRRLIDLARAVPEMLLDIGTSEAIFARIEAARDLLARTCGAATTPTLTTRSRRPAEQEATVTASAACP
jgi:hypothetical protein